eukprot:CAMPEP_0116106950 /NCGR_PEP_ID=MMETSP0327-20121206/15936_1 /TAXON_ID=44447 /ORGANISM="Pseudo-nitzschia delicatissima, Strain B596" /LENGTH=475 /DNA_ID=CAMNT_0003599651 /DNA_START=95 /DNA_END=1522 /DNA_ORIENTATION=-
MDASFVSEQSGATSDTKKKKKKGLKKLGSGLKNALGGKRRKSRKKRSSASGSVGSQSYDGQSYNDGDSAYSAQSQDLPLLNADGSANTQAQQEWINGGGSGLAEMEMAAIRGSAGSRHNHNSAGGRGRSLGKIPELPDEDEEGVVETRKRGTRRKVKSDAASVSSRDSRRSFFGRKQKAKADPLSLVVLLVEPSSLRFELLSLDFDLKPSRRSRSRRMHAGANADADLELTVRDVLDQITPEALTDSTLKKKAAGQCKGLIDRSGAVHFGPASLEAACAQRPLRALDTALLKQQQNIKLGVPTYGGEPHRDVLLGFFGSDVIANDEGVLSDETKEEVAIALELARPIFCDPGVVGLMEANGFDLKRWKSEPKPKAKLGKPLPAKERAVAKKPSLLPIGKLLLGLLAVVLATVLAWSLVAGGLHLLPSIADGDAATSPSTLEGHILWAFESAKSWYNNYRYNDTMTAVVSKKKFSF